MVACLHLANPMKICLVQFNPTYPKAGILDCFNEVIETYHWGFAALGHDVGRRINDLDPRAINIIFGPQVLSNSIGLPYISRLPKNTIIYNFEPFRGKSLSGTPEAFMAQNYQIWDYSADNISSWTALAPKHLPYHAKIAYAPVLEKIPCGVEQDIDILYYGSLTADRLDALFFAAKQYDGINGLTTMALSNVWGTQRDEFIARAKVILNLSGSNSFEIVRVSYLLANRKAVICAYKAEPKFEQDLEESLTTVNNSDVLPACRTLVEDDAIRTAYAERGYEAIKRRDVRNVITDFFARSTA